MIALTNFFPSELSFRATPRKLVAEPVLEPSLAMNSEYNFEKLTCFLGYTPVESELFLVGNSNASS